MPDIYKNVATLAEKKNLSISEVERRADLSKGSICKWKDSSPTVENLLKVAQALSVSIGRLLKE